MYLIVSRPPASAFSSEGYYLTVSFTSIVYSYLNYGAIVTYVLVVIFGFIKIVFHLEESSPAQSSGLFGIIKLILLFLSFSLVRN